MTFGFLSRGALAALALLAACSPGSTDELQATPAETATAEAFASSAGDPIDPATYRLSMDRVRQWVRVMQAVGALGEEQPEVEEEFAADVDESLGEYVDRIERSPALRSAVEGAGMSVLEHAVIARIFLEAALAEASAELGQDPAEVAGAFSTHPDNRVFLREHKAEIDALAAQAAQASGSDHQEP